MKYHCRIVFLNRVTLLSEFSCDFGYWDKPIQAERERSRLQAANPNYVISLVYDDGVPQTSKLPF